LLFGQPGNGKTSIIRTIVSEYNFKPVTFVPGANADALRETFYYAEEQSPSLLYIEDLDSLIENGLDVSTFLNLLDGISAKNGLLVIATANDVRKLKSNITRRPSRFDRKFEIPLPNQEMAYIYLKRWFGNIIDVKKCRELAKLAVKHELSYAYLKDLYVSSVFEALAHKRKTPTVKDIDNTLIRLVKDKNILNNGNTINTDKYFKNES
jgi:SpoVK/Ycf46/Vps4 family AAA+-type ATPase